MVISATELVLPLDSIRIPENHLNAQTQLIWIAWEGWNRHSWKRTLVELNEPLGLVSHERRYIRRRVEFVLRLAINCVMPGALRSRKTSGDTPSSLQRWKAPSAHRSAICRLCGNNCWEHLLHLLSSAQSSLDRFQSESIKGCATPQFYVRY